MKARILIGYYTQETGYEIHRVYLEKDFEQAEKDLGLVRRIHEGSKDWTLEECELY